MSSLVNCLLNQKYPTPKTNAATRKQKISMESNKGLGPIVFDKKLHRPRGNAIRKTNATKAKILAFFTCYKEAVFN